MRILVDADTKQFLGAAILRAAGGRPVIQVIGTAMRAGVHYRLFGFEHGDGGTEVGVLIRG